MRSRASDILYAEAAKLLRNPFHPFNALDLLEKLTLSVELVEAANALLTPENDNEAMP